MSDFFSPSWAESVRAALTAGPSEQVRAAKLQEYWDFFDLIKSLYPASWALGCRDLPGLSGTAYLFVRWGGGTVTDCRIIGPDEPLGATYVLGMDYQDWKALHEGYDAQRTVMYRKILLEEGNLLEFFKAIYFFVESLAVIGSVPGVYPETIRWKAGDSPPPFRVRDRAADVGGAGRGQEQARFGHVIGGGHPAQGHGGGDRRHPVGVAVVRGGRFGGHEAGDHGVQPDLGRPLDGQAGHQVVQAGLGRAVGGGARGRPGAAHAADHDDRPAVGLGLHDLVGGLRDVQRRDQVQLDDPGVEARGGGGGRRGRGPAGVADHHVHAAEQVHGGRDQLPGLLGVPDVRAGELRGPAARGRQRGGGGLVPGADQDPRAGAQEPARDARADALGPAGDDHPAAVEAGKGLVDGPHGAMLGSRPSKR